MSLWAQLPFAAPGDGGEPQLTDVRRWLPSELAVDEFAVGCVSAALRAGALWRGEACGRVPDVTLSAAHVADLVRAEAFVAVDGVPGTGGFAPLSRFWPTGEGWVRTHANYPWHRAALLRATGTPGDPESVAQALAGATAMEWESRIVAEGGVAAAMRTRAEWESPDGPLVAVRRVAGAPPRSAGRRLRVLDLTRVLAGPAGTRLLGALGADVLRVDAPQRPELPFHQVDGVIGKRSALLDLTDREAEQRFSELLAGADVLVHGYRPGSSAAGDVNRLAERHPGLIAVQLSAWDGAGTWARRRGFDSVVQSACGIAHLLKGPDGRPGALPCQLLDHGTGYLIAASVLLAAREQARTGGSYVLALSLARTAEALLATPVTALEPCGDRTDWTSRLTGTGGRSVTAVRAPGAYDAVPLRWPEPVSTYGSDAPVWL